MKKRFLTLAASIFLGAVVSVGITACGWTPGNGSGGSGSSSGSDTADLPHKHAYSALYTEDPTCDEQGYTMFYCDCGEHFKANFVEKLGHAYGDWSSNGDGTHSRVCSRNEEHKETANCSGGTATETDRPVCDVCHSEYGSVLGHTHVFTEQKITDKFLASSATCTEKAKYYYSCQCGEKGATTFEYGTKLGHAYGDWMSNGDGTHTKTCSHDETHKITENCTGGTASCTEKATCTDCGEKYGNLADHTYNQKNTGSKYLASSATCTKKAVYYYSCQCGEKGTTTFEYGELAAHKESDWVIDKEATATEEGSKHTYCTVCEKTLQTATIAKIKESVGLKYSVNDDGVTCSITGIGTCTDTDLVIPEKINGYKVTSIHNNAFNSRELTSVEIPEGVTSIGSSAFSGCSSLTSIVIPDSVISIGAEAFWKCNSLTSIDIPNSVTSIEFAAFNGCISLKYNTLNGVNYLGNENNPYHAVVSVVSKELSSYTLNGKVKVIVGGAFDDCSSLTSIVIPDSVTSIGDYAFDDCNSLTSIEIPDSVESIGDYAFGSCSSLTSITVSSGNIVYHSAGNCIIKTDDKKLVVGCKNSVIPADGSVTSIGDGAFWTCWYLERIVIPNSIESIGRFAFFRCGWLKNVTIGDGVESIGVYAFNECDALTSITVSSGNEVYHSVGNCLIKTADKTLVFGCKSSIIPTDGAVTSIGDTAFSECRNLTSIDIPDGVESIGEAAFRRCRSLTSIVIPDSVTSIGEAAFRLCESLTSITYNGTKEQWNAIEKGTDWKYNSLIKTIHCTDGDVTV